MARDGTRRGGRRPRSGEKLEALVDKLSKGKEAHVIDLPDFQPNPLSVDDLEVGGNHQGIEMPNPSEYLSAKQRDGTDLGADEIYIETWEWLRDRGCERLVNKRLIETYSQAMARYIQCEEAISTFGLLGKHPTTGGAIASPFVGMSQNYQKQASLIWYEIFEIVKQNSTTAYVGNPMEDTMERLLRKKGNG
ncbi:terminase [Facklamia hominis]